MLTSDKYKSNVVKFHKVVLADSCYSALSSDVILVELLVNKSMLNETNEDVCKNLF